LHAATKLAIFFVAIALSVLRKKLSSFRQWRPEKLHSHLLRTAADLPVAKKVLLNVPTVEHAKEYQKLGRASASRIIHVEEKICARRAEVPVEFLCRVNEKFG